MVFTAAPNGIRPPQPERRRKRARREVHVEIRFLGAKLADQMNRRVEVAVERASRRGARDVARAVELELIHPEPANHVHARVAEALIVNGARQRETAVVRLEALLLSIGDTIVM